MRSLKFPVLVLLFALPALLSCAPVPLDNPPGGNSPATRADPEATRIEIDQNTGSIRFIVNGREEARINASGMQVRQNLQAATTTVVGDNPDAFNAPASGAE